MNSIPSFDFCAFSFLIQWLESECALHRAISSAPTEKDIRKALAYFQVARTFKDLDGPGKTALILRYLIEVRNDPALLTPHEKVDKLASEFQNSFQKFNVSAASKLLWLSCRDPFVVYDARAVNALTRHFGHRFTNYSEYTIAWRKEYSRAESLIQAAVVQLPKGRTFMRSCPLSDQELMALAKEIWFTERVFDVFLWEVGMKDTEW